MAKSLRDIDKNDFRKVSGFKLVDKTSKVNDFIEVDKNKKMQSN